MGEAREADGRASVALSVRCAIQSANLEHPQRVSHNLLKGRRIRTEHPWRIVLATPSQPAFATLDVDAISASVICSLKFWPMVCREIPWRQTLDNQHGGNPVPVWCRNRSWREKIRPR
jgi:hypothetical protein